MSKVSEHRGIAIEVSGIRFTCTMNVGTGETRLYAPSVAALKKQIDKRLEAQFKPFRALYIDHRYRADLEIAEVEVVERLVERRRGYETVTYAVKLPNRVGNVGVSANRLYPLALKDQVVAYVEAKNAESKRQEAAEAVIDQMERDLRAGSLEKTDAR